MCSFVGHLRDDSLSTCLSSRLPLVALAEEAAELGGSRRRLGLEVEEVLSGDGVVVGLPAAAAVLHQRQPVLLGGLVVVVVVVVQVVVKVGRRWREWVVVV